MVPLDGYGFLLGDLHGGRVFADNLFAWGRQVRIKAEERGEKTTYERNGSNLILFIEALDAIAVNDLDKVFRDIVQRLVV